jgi:acetyl-CoA synthetase (ADP-forming)
MFSEVVMSSSTVKKAIEEGRTSLFEFEAKELLSSVGIPVTKSVLATTVEEAVNQAKKIGFPIVCKIVSPDILHKSDAGGVKVGIKTLDETDKVFAEIISNAKRYKSDATITGVLIQEMAPQGREVIVGAIRDPQFGPALMFGLGGIFVEVLKDVAFRIAPLSEYDAKNMIKEIKGYPLLKGVRGESPIDEQALVKILLGVSKIVSSNSEISELDLNPVFAYEKGAIVADARVLLEKNVV